MPRPDVREERRPQIIDAAIRVFLRKGYHKATMPEIAREAGLSVGGMYWYFKGRKEIVMDILRQVFQSDLDDLTQLLRSQAPTAERLQAYAAQYAQCYDEFSWLDPIGFNSMPNALTTRRRVNSFANTWIIIVRRWRR